MNSNDGGGGVKLENLLAGTISRCSHRSIALWRNRNLLIKIMLLPVRNNNSNIKDDAPGLRCVWIDHDL